MLVLKWEMRELGQRSAKYITTVEGSIDRGIKS